MNKQPIRVLSLGAGVQSTTLLLMMAHGEIEPAQHAVFADTGWEPEAVYEHLGRLRPVMANSGIEFHLVSNGDIRNDFLADGKRFASMPLHIKNQDGKKAMMRRQCTNEYKLKPLRKKQRELAGLQPRQRSKEHLMTTIIGISWDESQRMRDAEFPWMNNEYPLIDLKMTREDCIKWCEEKGYPRPPRSACIGCPFKNAEEWRELRKNEKEWQDAVDFDNELRRHPRILQRFNGKAYLHSSTTPLTEADLRTKEEMGVASLFDQECQGMCGL